MKIKYYAKACNCSDFKPVIEKACADLAIKVSKLETFADDNVATQAGIPELPALLINDQLVFSGFLPSFNKLKKILKKHQDK